MLASGVPVVIPCLFNDKVLSSKVFDGELMVGVE
jgi:hypothetical protein